MVCNTSPLVTQAPRARAGGNFRWLYNGLYEAELVHNFGPWPDAAHLERGTAAWWNTGRLHAYCGWVPPAEAEAVFWAAQPKVKGEDAA